MRQLYVPEEDTDEEVSNMTINELIVVLQQRREMHGGDTVVRVTWEGTAHDIDLQNIYYSTGPRRDRYADSLWIDADGNNYRPLEAV